MARELLSKVVDGKEYQFSQFGAKQALRVLMRLGKIVGEPLTMAIASADGAGPLADRSINLSALSGAVKTLMQHCDEAEVLDLIELLTAREALCNGAKIEFNTHYEGQLPHLFKVLYAALEVQYGNFLGALKGLSAAGSPLHTTQAHPA